MEQDLLLLQILKIPVIVIKFLAKIFSILTYLPNYLLLLIVDHFLFSQQYSATMLIYIIMWLPKIVLLVFSLAIFYFQFYGVYYLLQLEEHSFYLQMGGLVLAFSGLLILMRKGYLSLIQKYNLNKLKSVRQHIELGYFLLVDVINIVLVLVNTMLLMNVKKTFSYKYEPNIQYGYLRFIFNCVRESIIFYIQFFYVKIFFKLFPWRFVLDQEMYKKQKAENNVLNCLVLLTLNYIFTMIDLVFICTFGLFNVLHYRRKVYLQKIKNTHIKWKITFSHFGFAFLQTIEIILQILMLPVCWSQAKFCLKMLINEHQNIQHLFGSQFRSLLMKCMLRLPYFACNIFIFISYYKWRRRNMLVDQFHKKNQGKKDTQYISQNQLIVQYKTFQCFFQGLIDSIFFILLLPTFLTKPWQTGLFKYSINNSYVLQRRFILKVLFKNLVQLLLLPVLILLNGLILIYRFKKPLDNHHKSIYNLKEQEQHRGESGRQLQMWKLEHQSWIAQYFSLSWHTLRDDLPFLPFYFIIKATFLTIYWTNMQPTQSPSLLYKLYGQYYYLSVAKSDKGLYYLEMCKRMKQKDIITCQQQNTIFWKKAYRLQRVLLIQKILSVFLRNLSIQKIKSKLIKGNTLSQLSNQYWYQYELTKAILFKIFFMIIQAIVSLIGFVFMLPLTLWRLPTFVKIYAFNNNKYLFFKILFAIYRQMARDLKYLPLKLVAVTIAPLSYLGYVRKSAFKYGPQGLDSFENYQKIKQQYFLNGVLMVNLIKIFSAFEVIFIYATWIRIRSLKVQIRKSSRLSIGEVFVKYLIKGPQIKQLEQMNIQDNNDYLGQNQASTIQNIHEIFMLALADFPYLVVILLLFVTMPWRFNYIIQAIREVREDIRSRKAFLTLLKNIFKDYACIFLNVVLLLSGFKTNKALLLIKRNYRLNFFIGFLEYSYFEELQKEIISLFLIYADILLLIFACLFGWTKINQIVEQLKENYKREKAEKDQATKNKRIFENTSNKEQLQLINRMGFYNYLNVCSYLSIPDIMNLRKVDKLNYQMTKRQQVWFTKWETIYTGKSNFIDQDYEIRCKKAYLLQNQINPRVVMTYHTIIQKHFRINVFQQTADIQAFCKQNLSEQHFIYIFKDYHYQLHEGYGPENQLPQQQNQDEQFLRLTNQVRRQKVELDQMRTYANWLFFKPIEKTVQFMHSYYRVDTNRRKKQLLLLLAAIVTVIVTILIQYQIVVSVLWLESSFIGVELLLGIYLAYFQLLLYLRINYIKVDWVSIIPFDIFYDFVRAWRYFVEEIVKKKIVTPTSNLLVRIGQVIKKIVTKIAEKVKAVGVKTVDFTVKYSVLAYQKVIKPLYLKIADLIRKIMSFFTFMFKKVYLALKAVVNAVYSAISTFFHAIYDGIHAIFSNANKLYYFILQKSMKFFLKFGLLGNLVFTILGLIFMTLPTLIWWKIYSERWYLIVSSIHTMVLIVMGYKHLYKIKQNP